MRRSLLTLSVIALLLNPIACERNNFDAPRKFFSANKIGDSPDYGVMKNGNDHVITVHGFMNDLAVCLELVEALNKNVPGVYSCQPLNH